MPTYHGSTASAAGFNDLIERWGYDYILVHANTRFRCPRYNPAIQDCEPADCQICHGLTYIHNYEVHTMYKSLNQQTNQSVPTLLPFLFYAKSTAGMNEEDKILEVRWGANGEITEVLYEYEIVSVYNYKMARNDAYSVGACSKVVLTTSLKTLQYLNDIKQIGFIARLQD
jgi:hypothetical protein